MPVCTPKDVNLKFWDQWQGKTIGLSPRLSAEYPTSQRPYENPNDRPLATLQTIIDAYQGGFIVDQTVNGNNTDGDPVKIDNSTARIAYCPKRGSIFTSSQAGGRANDSIIEIKLPDDSELTTDPSTFPVASNVLQGWTTVLNNSRLPVVPNYIDDLGGFFWDSDEDALIGTAYNSYSGGDYSAVMFKISDASDIANSPVLGAWRMDGNDEAGNWLHELEPIWRFHFGATHILGNGAGMSNQQRYSRGPSAWLTNFPSIDMSGAYATVAMEKLMSFPYGQFGDPAMGTALYGNKTHTPENHNEYNDLLNDGYAYTYAHEIEPADNNVWTRMTSAAGAFMVPGCSTYAVFGQVTGGESGGGYKIIQQDGDGNDLPQTGGPAPADPSDSYAWYWLFRAKDMEDATDKSTPVPYEHGKLPFALNVGELPRSAILDPRTNTAFISCAAGAYGGQGSPLTFLKLKFEV